MGRGCRFRETCLARLLLRCVPPEATLERASALPAVELVVAAPPLEVHRLVEAIKVDVFEIDLFAVGSTRSVNCSPDEGERPQDTHPQRASSDSVSDNRRACSST